MKQQKIAGVGMLATIGFIFLLTFFTQAITPEMYQSCITLGGFGILVFGIWSGILLIKA